MAKFLSFKCITKERFPIGFYIIAAKIKMGGLIYRQGFGHYVVTGWGWERNGFVLHVQPLRYPKEVAA